MEQVRKLELRGVTRRFANNTALHHFDLEIPGCAFVSLLGPSGCGKSTALNCIAGLLDPTEGEIILNDKPIHHLPAEKRGFGMVFQNYALFPHLTVGRNVSYGLELTHMPKVERDRRIRWALNLVHLDPDTFGDRYPAQLSGGQQQRLAFARAIVLEPSLLLLDEPLSNLDAKLRNEMRIEIKRLHKELNCTTIYVTHDQSEAMSLSDIVVVMKQGHIEQVGTPQEIYTCPKSLYVADFMGYSNCFAVEVLKREGEYWLVKLVNEVHEVQLHASSPNEQVDWQPGQRLVACARPDETLVDPPPDFNKMQGVVHISEYTGKAFEVALRLDNDNQFMVLAHSQCQPTQETQITFGIRPDHLLLFEPEVLPVPEVTLSRKG